MLEAERFVDEVRRKAGVDLAERLNKEGVDPEDDGVCVEVGAHPEGRKRGGVVSVFSEGDVRVFYNDTACEWCVYDW